MDESSAESNERFAGSLAEAIADALESQTALLSIEMIGLQNLDVMGFNALRRTQSVLADLARADFEWCLQELRAVGRLERCKAAA